MAKFFVRKIEAVQSIQNALNSIPLVGGKLTYVRVYLKPEVLTENSLVSAYLKADDENGTALENIPCMEPIRVKHGSELHDQRLDWSQSLNFRLPDGFLRDSTASSVRFEITSATQVSPTNATSSRLTISGQSATTVDLVKDPDFHCRLILFRHRDFENLEYVCPAAGESAAIQRFVECAFPVAEVKWSLLSIAAPKRFRALGRVLRESIRTREQITLNYMNFFQHLLAIRDQDIWHGRDERTIYLGVISDPSARFGGAAMDSPQFTAPHVVAVTSAESEGHLGAHELGHVLGCRHPGIPDRAVHGPRIGQHQELKNHGIHPAGYLSAIENITNGEVFLGLDTRFSRNMPAVLPYDQWFDLMTYRYPKWVSSQTYTRLQERLQQVSGAERFQPGKGSEPVTAWTVIGEYDLMRKTGRIRYLMPSRYQTSMPSGNEREKFEDEASLIGVLKLAWDASEQNDGKPATATECVNIRNYKNKDGSHTFGVFQHTLALNSRNDEYRDIVPASEPLAGPGNGFLKSLENLFGNNGCVSLWVNDTEVDRVGGCEAKESQEILDEIVEIMGIYSKYELSGFKDEDPENQDKLNLYYSVDDGGYYLFYTWSDKRWTRSRITTAIACKRKRPFKPGDPISKPGEPEWETIAVSGRLTNSVWISPVFFNAPTGVSNPDELMHDIYGEHFYGGGGIEEQVLDVKITIFSGFYSKEYKLRLKASDKAMRACGSRRERPFFRPMSETSSSPEIWYEDSATNCENPLAE